MVLCADQTEAAAVAAAQQAGVLSQLIARVGNLSRRCNASDEQSQQQAALLRMLQQEAAELQAQLVRAEDHQQAAAAQMSQVLSINRNLQCTVEDMCCELEEERAARRGMEAQLAALQQQVSLQQQAVDVLQGAVGSTAAEVEQLQEAASHSSGAMATLAAGQQQLRKKLVRMQTSDSQLGQELKDTQTVVAKEFAALRRHMQLAGTRTAQASRSHRVAVTARVAALGERVEQLQEQLVLLKSSAALAAAGCKHSKVAKQQTTVRRGGCVRAASAAKRQPGGLIAPVQRQQEQQQQQQQEEEYDALAEALMSSESSDFSAAAALPALDAPNTCNENAPQPAVAAAEPAAGPGCTWRDDQQADDCQAANTASTTFKPQASTCRRKGASSKQPKQARPISAAPGPAARTATSSYSGRRSRSASSSSGMQRAVLLQGKGVLLLAQVLDASSAKHAAACWVPC
uniref:Uncharacterized protein n=1 Tax=Tetradesmus obliquus TaxID=3088 RepID=A0A383VPA5_TETOB|eukprot:jgi/Sobl393_1/12815/SZX66256.1